jgi:ubiquinone/menaquinone biosynthesis C-methylase UbiE
MSKPLSDNPAETERVRRLMDKGAPRYDRQMNFFDRVLFGGGRAWACSHAEGEVLEIAVGSGRNLAFHAEETSLTAIEFSPEMLELARERATELGRKVDLRLGDAQDLEFAEESFDTVVCTLALCTIPDPGKAVAEAHRVLSPGGRFVALEHVRSPALPVRTVQRALDPLTVRFEGDHLVREPLEYLRSAGFEVEQLERSKWGIVERVVARKPGNRQAAIHEEQMMAGQTSGASSR